MLLFTELPRASQHVEKVAARLICSPKLAFSAPKQRGSGVSKPNQGPEAGHGEFFNSLKSTRKLGGIESIEEGQEVINPGPLLSSVLRARSFLALLLSAP